LMMMMIDQHHYLYLEFHYAIAFVL
jgi:hypothetical protein